MSDEIRISVVIPAYNERANIMPLYRDLRETMDALGENYEIVWIDDGSLDGTFEEMRDIADGDPAVSVISLRRNFGQTAAMSAGFKHARGEVVITMDADGQNDPRDIPLLLEKLEEGFDIVSGWRKDRQDTFLNRVLPSRVANAIISWVTGVKLHDYGCSLKAYRREVVKSLDLYGELHRFIPAMASWHGVKLTEVVVRHHPRLYGASKYSLDRAIKVLLDLITVRFLVGFSTRPVHWFGTTGLMTSVVGVAFLVYMSGRALLHDERVLDRPLFILSVVLFMMGIQMIMLGLLAEVQVRTYHEARDKTIFAIQETIDGGGSSVREQKSDEERAITEEEDGSNGHASDTGSEPEGEGLELELSGVEAESGGAEDEGGQIRGHHDRVVSEQ